MPPLLNAPDADSCKWFANFETIWAQNSGPLYESNQCNSLETDEEEQNHIWYDTVAFKPQRKKFFVSTWHFTCSAAEMHVVTAIPDLQKEVFLHYLTLLDDWDMQ